MRWGLLRLGLLSMALCAATDSTNLIDVISKQPELTRFVHLLQRTRLLPTLNRIQELDSDRTGMTLFVPNNAAFERAMQGDTPEAKFWRDSFDDSIPDNVHAALRQRLWYHVLNFTMIPHEGLAYVETLYFPSHKRLQEPIRPGPIPQPPSEPPHPGAEDKGGLLAGGRQWMRVLQARGATRVGVDPQGLGGAAVVGEDHRSPRGVVYVLDDVLQVPATLLAFLQSSPDIAPVFSLLPNETLNTLSTTAHLTMFLPTRKALKALHPLELAYLLGPWPEANQDRLALFAWHASSIGLGDGRIGYASRLRDAGQVQLTTVMGGNVHVKAPRNGAIEVGGAHVVQENLLTQNGVVHTVDKLHLPFGDLGMTVEKYLLVLGAERFVRLLHVCGLAHYINQDPHEPPRAGEPQGSLTFVAPSNAALDRWLHEAQDMPALTFQGRVRRAKPQSDKDNLRELLLYHILPGCIVPNSHHIGTLLPTELRPPTLDHAAQRLAVTQANKSLLELGGVRMRSGPTFAVNATIYLSDALLPLPQNALQTATRASKEVAMYLAAAATVGLEDQIRTKPSTTYFVPVDQAFFDVGLVAKYWMLRTDQSRRDLVSVLDYHTLLGVHYRASFPSQWTKYATNADATLSARVVHGALQVRGSDASVAQAVASDLLTETGTVHLIDRVQYPPMLSITMEKLMLAANASVMVRWVRLAGFAWVLDGMPRKRLKKPVQCGEKTVLLVPNDDAFAKLNVSYYESNPELLRALVAQHILTVDTCAKIRHPTRQRLPLPLRDEAVHASLLDRSQGGSSNFGTLAFRSVSEPQQGCLGYVVGIKGSRGTSGDRYAANVLEFGKTQDPVGNLTWAAGILTLDTVLEPFHPGWFYYWAWLSLATVFSIVTLGAVGGYVYICMRSRGYRPIREPLEGEEE